MHGMTVVDRALVVELAATARDAAAAGPVNPYAALQMQQMHQVCPPSCKGAAAPALCGAPALLARQDGPSSLPWMAARAALDGGPCRGCS